MGAVIVATSARNIPECSRIECVSGRQLGGMARAPVFDELESEVRPVGTLGDFEARPFGRGPSCWVSGPHPALLACFFLTPARGKLWEGDGHCCWGPCPTFSPGGTSDFLTPGEVERDIGRDLRREMGEGLPACPCLSEMPEVEVGSTRMLQKEGVEGFPMLSRERVASLSLWEQLGAWPSC